ncbi:MAG: hypothetical protein D6746_11395 [Bacteroidetes bacterium]|nr:MAG: hypothetical protein D6746_11395 [Bacteroidota bacterium]
MTKERKVVVSRPLQVSCGEHEITMMPDSRANLKHYTMYLAREDVIALRDVLDRFLAEADWDRDVIEEEEEEKEEVSS